MKKLLKIFGYVLLGAVVLSVGLVVVMMNADKIEYQWGKYTFEPRVVYKGVDVNTPLSDIVFKLGKPDEEGERDGHTLKLWLNYSDENEFAVFADNKGEVETIIVFSRALRREMNWGYNHPVRKTEGLLQLMGDPDIYAASSDFVTRRYTYLDHGLTFDYEADSLDTVHQGEVEWRATSDNAEYRVMGEQICPGERCPWGSDGKLKPEFEGLSYRDL